MNKELKKSIEQAQIHWLTQRLEEYQELEVKYNNLKEEQIKDEVIRHIDEIVQKAIEVKYRDEEMLILQTIIKELNIKLGKEQNKIYLLKQRLIHNIDKIDEKLKNTKNPYDDPTIEVRKARLRAIKTKCKEILRWLDE